MFYEIPVKTTSREQMINITSQVQKHVQESDIKDGIAVLFNPHTTGAITINEGADPDVVTDILSALRESYPNSKKYLHMEGNSDAHIKSALMGSDRVIIIKNGKLALGTWQKLFFCEFDGPRQRKLYLKVIS